MELTTMRATWIGGLLALSGGILAAQPASAQTFYSANPMATCAAATCEVNLSFPAAMLLERVGCVFDMRAPKPNSPQIVRAVLRSVANSGGMEQQRQDLPFANTFDEGNRKIYVVGTNPLFGISATQHGVVTVIATGETTNIKIECYASGYSQP